MIVAGDLLDFNDDKAKVFTVAIQLGAILAVCWEYRERLMNVIRNLGTRQANRFVMNLLIAFLPAAVLGLLFIETIKHYLFHPMPVAIALIIGGILILWIERQEHRVEIETVDDMDWKRALKVGCAQCLALIQAHPALVQRLSVGCSLASRKTAAEFSFFLAIPVMFAATFYDVYKHREFLHSNDLGMFAVGFTAAFSVH